jgi:hypothetical protein
MADIKSVRVLYVKGGLFVLLGVLAGVGILMECFNWRVGVLMGVMVWAFCRAYYFAFYVVEHYADPGYRFAGLLDFFRYAMKRR